MKLSARPVFVAVWLVVLWGIATVMIFFSLGRRTERQISDQIRSWSTNFEDNWIVYPDNYPDLFRTMKTRYFDEIEKSQQLFRSVVLTWVHPSGKEVILYPTQWIRRNIEEIGTTGWVSVPIREPYNPDKVYGHLYFQLDPWERWGTTIAFLLAAFNVLFLLMFLLYWLTRISHRYEAVQSELRQKKKELIQLEQLALAGRLSAGLLHDLKKPVIHIREECADVPEETALMKDIRDQCELFLAMLRDSGLEGFAKRRSVHPEYCDVIDLVERSLRLVEYERNDVEVGIETKGEVPLVWARPTRLMQVFSNLILNAYQAMKGRGRLTVRIAGRARADGSRWAVVTLCDTGPGIPAEDRQRVFEPFYTTGSEGSGLGLYIVKTIVEDLGGEIRVLESESGGACFEVLIPEKDT